MNTPDGTSDGLAQALHRWCETLEAVRITLMEDRPQPGFTALGDGLADGTDDVLGWLREAEADLAAAGSHHEIPRLIARAVRRQGETLFAAEHQVQLERLARQNGAAWAGWVRAFRSATVPLWSCADEVIQQLVAAAPLRTGDSLSHTTYHATHFTNSDTINPSAD